MGNSTILTSGVRSNLLSLQSTSTQAEKIQGRLATGKRVNSALDNPTNFFTAQSLSARANDLKSLLDGISNGIKTIEAANNGISTIKKLVESAQSAAKQAVQDKSSVAPSLTGTGTVTSGGAVGTTLQTLTITFDSDGTGSTAARTLTLTVNTASTTGEVVTAINASASLGVTASIKDGKLLLTSASAGRATSSSLTVGGSATVVAGLGFDTGNNSASGTLSSARKTLEAQYNDILDQIDTVAKDSGYNGVNLLESTGSLKVVFNERTGASQSKITIAGADSSSSGLGLSKAVAGDFQDDSSINTQLDNLNTALTSLRTNSSTFGSNLSIVEARKEFTSQMANTLQSGADNLVIADTNEEGANLLALQTRQQLSTTALSLANQASQSVLRLF